MRDRHAQEFASGNLVRERQIGRFRSDENMFATELKRAIANQSSRQKASLTENLKAVANAEYNSAIRCEVLHGGHDWTESRNRSGSQIIAVAKPTRDNHRIDVAQR